MKRFQFILVAIICLIINVETQAAQTGIQVLEAKGWKESAYITWQMSEAHESYHVYYAAEGQDFVQIDQALLRRYPDHARADVPGLKAGNYRLKIVPVNDGQELGAEAIESESLSVIAHDRSGYAHFKYNEGIGAYNNDGSLKANTQVFYITPENAKSISGTVDGIACTGFQALVNARQKGKGSTPLCFRIIGCIKAEDMDAFGSSSEGLQVKGKNAHYPMNITIEGIGNDACINGFGMLLRNCASVEVRNLGILNFMDDGISIDTDNSHCWVHHIDFFYGQAGGDSDQAKGDGSLDCKGDSQFMTFSYNRFWDSGKMALCGMTSESGENFISYHHNWFDHSDSRHPRVRTMTVHVWNNYFDGVAKYGVGATMGSNVFVEANYYRNVNKPMLISLQGSDISGGKGTFSGEQGGMIKAFGNVFAEKSGNFKFVPHTQSATGFDAYLASSREEKVPAEYKTISGGHSYNNFDTDPEKMYSYEALPAEEVPAYVTGFYGAGRLQHGDLQWTFDNAKDDASYDVITALKSAVNNYSSSLIGIVGEADFSTESGGDSEDDGGSGDGSGSGSGGGTSDGSGSGGSEDDGSSSGGSSDGGAQQGYECHFSDNKASNSFYTLSNANFTNSKGSVTVNGVTYSNALKMESSTVLSFSTKESMQLTMIFISTHSTPKVKVDGKDYDIVNGEVNMELPAGDHKITKNTSNTFLFYINLYQSTGLSYIDSDNSSLPCHDLYGRKIQPKAKGQIYIQNGKKVLIKQ